MTDALQTPAVVAAPAAVAGQVGVHGDVVEASSCTPVQMQMSPRHRYSAEEIIAAYQQTGSVWRAGKVLGIAGQTVHERLIGIGYPMASRVWTEEEHDELRALIAAEIPLGQIARRLGRPYQGVASKASRMGLKSKIKRQKRLPRGAGFDKANTLRHMKNIETYAGKVTQYARANGLLIETLVQALQKHCADRWEIYVRGRSDLATARCGYCETEFVPFTAKQRYCTRKCAGDARQDRNYFGGKRSTTIGLAEGICQLCERHVTRGLSSHHVLGKENDPDNEFLVALCQGCHQIVTFLGSRIFVDNETAWESLITLVHLRRHGAEIAASVDDPAAPDTVHVCVDIDVYRDDGES